MQDTSTVQDTPEGGFAPVLRRRPSVQGVTLYTSGPPRRANTLRVLRTRLGYWLLFFVPAAATVLAWNSGYFQTAGLTGLAAAIGLAWFVRVWRETEG
jgi:hypothetical protein